VLAEVGERASDSSRSGPVRVLVAPSWGDCSLIEAPVGLELLDVLRGAGYETVLRLHPMTVRRCPKLVAELERRCSDDPLVDLETDMNAIESWLRSDLMISDWSGAAIEYGFSLLRPILYVDTPQKQVNPDWRAIGMAPFEEEIRSELGSVVEPSEISTVPAAIEALLADPDAVRERALEARARWVFNVGRSAAVAAEYLASLPGLRSTSAGAQPRSAG
jgi:YidC/Oxa1 family membrane protein insertase